MAHGPTSTSAWRALSKEGDTPETKRGAPGSRAWLLVSRSRDSSSVLQPCFANVLAYLRFDDLLASLRVNNWPRAPQQERERPASGTLPPPPAGMETLLRRPVFGVERPSSKRRGYSRFVRQTFEKHDDLARSSCRGLRSDCESRCLSRRQPENRIRMDIVATCHRPDGLSVVEAPGKPEQPVST